MQKKNDKRVVQDIVSSTRRSIRRIPPRVVEVEEDVREEHEEKVYMRKIRSVEAPPVTSPRPAERISKKRRLPSILLTFVVVFISIAVIAVALSLLYSKAAVTITPKTAHIDVNTTLTAKKTSDASLVYTVVTATESLSQTVPATDGPDIETKAKGVVTLYNDQATQQKIVAGTRLSNAAGDIYRTTATIVIPQAKNSSTPGSIAVAVLADAAGTEYNMPQSAGSDLKIVAYKGTPKYTTVYGLQKTAISGGFSGNKEIIAPDVETATVQSLKDSLKTKLQSDVKALVSADSILYDAASMIDYVVLEPISKDKQTTEITVKGTINGAEFKKNDLLKAAAAKDLDKFSAPTYEIQGMEDLKFTIINAKDFSAQNATPLIFSLKGPVTLVGTFSETALKNELKGTYLKDSNSIFAHYPAISNAYALITPFWMRYFPKSADKITVEIK